MAEGFGIKVGQSWTKTDVYFSYGACADPYSRATKPTNVAPFWQGMAANFAQFEKSACPYSVAIFSSEQLSGANLLALASSAAVACAMALLVATLSL